MLFIVTFQFTQLNSHVVHRGLFLHNRGHDEKVEFLFIYGKYKETHFLRFLQALVQLRTALFLSSHLVAAVGTGLCGSTAGSAKSSPDYSWGGVIQGEEEANSRLNIKKSTIRIQELSPSTAS